MTYSFSACGTVSPYMKVLVTQRIPAVCFDILKEGDVAYDILGDRVSKKKKLCEALKGNAYDGVITLLTDTIDREVIDSMNTDVRIIANYAVGYDNIDIAAAKERNIVVTNTPGVLTDTVAEHAFALILAVATRIPEADQFVRKKKFTGWEPELLLGVDLKGQTLGIVGAGRIGFRVAELAVGFGMQILYHDMKKSEVFEQKVNGHFCESPEDLLRDADVVSLHLPLNDATHHFLNERRLALMQNHAILVNTSRGAVIDEVALTKALKEHRIFGAGLDVFEHEPMVGKGLRSLANVVLTPHIASASIATRNNMATMVANDVVAVLHGGTPQNVVSS